MRTELKKFRVGLHYRQSDMAVELGVSLTTYRKVETGEWSGKADFWSNLQKRFNVPDENMYGLMKIDETRAEKCETAGR